MTGFDGNLVTPSEGPTTFDLQAEFPLAVSPTLAAPENEGARRLREFRDRQLRRSILVALDSDPRFVAEAQRVGLAIGADPRLVEEDFDGYAQVMRRLEWERWERSGASPILRRQMRDPDFARVAHDDLDSLSGREAWAVGEAQRRLGQLVTRERDFGLTADETLLANEYRDFLEQQPRAAGFVANAGLFLGQMWAGATEIVGSALATGGGFGAVAGLASGPFAVITAPAAAILGAGIGAAGAAFKIAYETEGGLEYDTLRRIPGIDEDVAAWASRFHGLTAGLLEVTGVGLAARPVLGPARRALLRSVSQATAQALTRPTALELGLRVAEGYVTSVAGEALTEGAQEVSTILTEDVARVLSGLPAELLAPGGVGDAVARVGEAIAAAAMGMALLGIPGPGLNFIAGARRVQSSRAAADDHLARLDLAGKSKLRERAPDAYAGFANDVAAEQGNPFVFVDAGQFAQALRQTGLTKEELARDLPGVSDQLPAALASGGDVRIPAGTWEAKVYNTPLDAALQQHTRTTADGISQAELAEAEAVLQQQAPEVVKQISDAVEFGKSARRVAAAFRDQLMATERLTAQDARGAVAVYKAVVETQAARLGVTPEEFVAHPALKAFRVESAETPAAAAEGAPQQASAQPPAAAVEGAPQQASAQPPAAAAEGAPQQASAQPPAAAAEDALQQDVKGEFIIPTRVIRLLPTADLTTILHEMAHGFLEWYAVIATIPAAELFPSAEQGASPTAVGPTQVAADMATFLEWRGLTGGLEAWNQLTLEQKRPHHEAFAEAAEVYFFTGKAPTVELAGIFQRFRAVIVRLWRGLRNEADLVLDDEIRGVFDRMLASQDAIEHAESVRGMQPMFAEKPEGMSDSLWARYQQHLDSSLQEAFDKVQARSLKDMQWLSRAQGKTLRALQRKHDKLRKQIRDQELARVALEPVYRAIDFIRHGKLVTDAGTEIEFEGTHKLQTEAAKALLPEGATLKELASTNPDGLHPDDVADMFGFDSGEQLISAVLEARPKKDVADERTDARMLAEHGDLIDPAAVQRAVDEALHNGARSRFLATQIRALTGATMPVRKMVAAARAQARAILAQMPVGDIRAEDFRSAEQKANRAALRAAGKADTVAAVVAARHELLQHELVREAIKIEKYLTRAETRFRKLFQSDEKIGAKRMIDLVAIARAIVAHHGFTRGNATAQSLLSDVQTYNPGLVEELQPLVSRVTETETPYLEMPLEEFQLMTEAVDALWHRALRERQIEINGKKQQLGEFATEIVDILDPPAQERPDRSVSRKEKKRQSYGSWVASIRHMESWLLQHGDNRLLRLLFTPLREAFDSYLAEKHERVERLVKKIRALRIDRTETISAKGEGEINYVFADKLELLGALLHSGNESSLRKLLLGRNWTAQPAKRGGPIDVQPWYRTISRLIEEGKITKADMDLVQSIWDEFADIFPRAQEVHLDLYGWRAASVGALEIETPWGVYKGGYFPAKIDAQDVRKYTAFELTELKRRRDAGELTQQQYDAAARRLRTPDQAALEEQSLSNTSREVSSEMPSTGRGFMVTRVEANRPLNLNLRIASAALDDHLRFIHLQQPGRDILRLVTQADVASAINQIDPNAMRHIIMPWLQDTLQNRLMKSTKHAAADAFFAYLRANVGRAVMVAKLTVGVQQITGLGSALAYVPLKQLRSATWNWATDRRGTWDRVTAASTFMRNRLKDSIGQIVDDVRLLDDFLPASTPQGLREALHKIDDATEKYGYFMQRFFQVPVDLITWTAAHDHATSQGQSEQEAVRHADTVVRRSQASGTAADTSALERSYAFVRLFTQFQSFWLSSTNTILQEPSMKRIALIVPLVGLSGAAIAKVLEGGWEDDDDDGTMWDDVASWTFGETLRSAIALTGPAALLGPVITGDFGGRLTVGAAGSKVERSLQTIASVFDGEYSGADVRGWGDALTLVTGIPFSVPARAIGFEVDVQTGKKEPTGFGDHLRGLIVGR